jgi:hypothetical protein
MSKEDSMKDDEKDLMATAGVALEERDEPRDEPRPSKIRLRAEVRAGVGGVGGNGMWYP